LDHVVRDLPSGAQGFGRPLELAAVEEPGALGAAIIGAVGVGLCADLETAVPFWPGLEWLGRTGRGRACAALRTGSLKVRAAGVASSEGVVARVARAKAGAGDA